MIGRITMMWVGLAAGVATGLFQIKYEVQSLEGRLARVNHAILADQQAIHVLKAEWALLNRPGELAQRAAENLDLKPVTAAQIGLVGDLPRRREGAALAEAPAVPVSEIETLAGPAQAIALPPLIASAKPRQ
ncbi:MAG: cell division protein FtsL [Rhodospirillales bacterium]